MYAGPSSNEIDPAVGGVLPLFVFALLFFCSAFFGYGEIKYIVWGRTAEASIYGRQRYKYRDPDNPDAVDVITWDVFYQWNDPDDGKRRDRMSLGPFVDPPADYKIQIDYIPGELNSRPAGQRSYLAIGFVLISSIAIVVWFVIQWRRGVRHARRNGKPVTPTDIFKRWRRPTNVNYGRRERRYRRRQKKSVEKDNQSGWR